MLTFTKLSDMKRFYWLAPLFVIVLGSTPATGQEKQALDFDAFSEWKRIENRRISSDGNWVAYQVKPVKGDPTLVLYNTSNAEEMRYERGVKARFTRDARFLVFHLQPASDTIRLLKKKKTKGKDLPKDTLAILDLESGELSKTPGLKSYKMPEKWSGWLAYYASATDDPDNKVLTLLDLSSKDRYELPEGGQFTFAKKGPALAAISSADSTEGVYYFPCENPGFQPVWTGKGQYKSLTISEQGKQVAFLADPDTIKRQVANYGLYHWKPQMESAVAVVSEGDDFMPEDYRVSDHRQLRFSREGTRLYFGVAPPPILEDTTLLDDEIVQVEVWTYRDAKLYPQQKINLNKDRNRNYLAVFHTGKKSSVMLASPEVPEVQTGDEGEATHALGLHEESYYRATSWEGNPSRKDIYLIDVETGEQKLIESQVRARPGLSPMGKYVYWYSVTDTAWFAHEIAAGKTRQLTNNTTVPFYDELNDQPDYPYGYGIAGWTTNDDFVIIYDRYDAWLIDPRGHLKDNNMTRSREARRQLRYIRKSPDERAIEEVGPILFRFFDEKTKEAGYLSYNLHTTTKDILDAGSYAYDRRPLKAAKADKWIFTKESFTDFPDLYFAQGLRKPKKISNANPQQEEYRWGTAETYTWTSLDGQKLEGLLIKPEGFDPAQKYPMIVNFYERSSEGLHRHRAPFPHRSTISYSYYTSRGYVIFNPDVPYRIGYPGESAYNAVVSGVSALVDEGFIDRENIGIQGHSWGGYQIAHILTKTDLFKCAEAGAPVVNMVSAYGGIRWGSGFSRMFQYEHTQSRIGGTLWDKPLRYLENSPIFSADKINTPVLILHNDNDGAVPWYQGIEFFVALRRLNKPAWMLNYNGEPHWPLKLQNRIDFQSRMSQFFDHYLQAAPQPEWMKRGVPAIEKGIRQGLEVKP